jgi:UDP:flavonoid glycosyltransferase YjiC (YdhE family)
MAELGLGIRLDTYRFADADLEQALGRLLGDVALHGRLAGAAAEIQQRDGVRHAADVIERTATG